MKTYYFDMKDGAITRDTVGSQFSTTTDAIEHCKNLARQLRGNPRINDPNLYIRVIDESGNEIHREQVYKGEH